MLRHADAVEPPRLAGLYSGTVLAVGKDGQLQVAAPAPFDEDKVEAAAWARPCLPYGVFFLPEKGDRVWLAFENGNPDSPVWLGVWYPDGKAPEEAKSSPPKRRVIRTAGGHVIDLDDENTKIVIKDAGGNTVTLDGSGITLKDAAGAELNLTKLKTWLNGFTQVFATWVPVPMDGGAALKTAMGTYLGTNPVPM
jgi:hypothetical protein